MSQPTFEQLHEQRILQQQARVQAELRRLGVRSKYGKARVCSGCGLESYEQPSTLMSKGWQVVTVCKGGRLVRQWTCAGCKGLPQ